MKIKDILDHLERNQFFYIVGFAVITSLIMRGNLAQLGGGVEPMPDGGFANTASFIFRNKQTINVTTVLDRAGRGHPGWPVQNLETKQVFFSQKQAADAFGIGEGALSKHLRGTFPDAHGWHFQRVNLSAAA